MGVCNASQGCVTTDRVLIRDKHGRQVAQRTLSHARFHLRVPPGSYTVELLGDGKRTRGTLMQRRAVAVRARGSAHVRFLFAIP